MFWISEYKLHLHHPPIIQTISQQGVWRYASKSNNLFTY
jgi:hypothetical protein